MASKFSEDTYRADEILLEQIYKYAGYQESDLDILKKAVKQGDLAMESMVENAIAKVGNLERVDLKGMDFNDGSDAKKVTVVNQGTVRKPNRGAGFSTKNKTGVLRVVCVDTLVKEVFYFKIPPEFYIGAKQKRREKGLRIRFNMNGGMPDNFDRSTTTGELWAFRVQTFEELSS